MDSPYNIRIPNGGVVYFSVQGKFHFPNNMQEEGMHSRFPAGWRSITLIAAIACLVVLPFTPALAAKPTKAIDEGATGASLEERQPDSVDRPAKYARGNYVWPYATGPSYGGVDPARNRAPGVLHTPVGSFDLAVSGDFAFPAELKTTNRLSLQGVQYFIVQFEPQAVRDGAFLELEQVLAAEGGAWMHSMPVSGAVVRLTPGAYSRIQTMGGLLRLEPYHPALKLDPSIGRTPLLNPLKALSEVYDLHVQLFNGEQPETVAEALMKLGGNVLAIEPDAVIVELHRSQLSAVAAMEPVRMIWERLPITKHAEETTTTMQIGRWGQGAIPYHDAGIDGSGNGLPSTSPQVLMVLDSGFQIDAGDLSHSRTSADGPGIGASHRKVLNHSTTNTFGGSGDALGCDAPASGGWSHGHFAAATALGNATDVPAGYGTGWLAENPAIPGQTWKLDGVAPGAKLVAYDASPTPSTTSCDDPEGTGGQIYPGNLYPGGSLDVAYTTYGANTANFSWGIDDNTYDVWAQDVDDFLDATRDAMVFTSSGNAGLDEAPEDGILDEGSIGTPATFKNGLAIGASRNADDPGTGPNQRAYASSVGPVDTSNRIAPQLMAPGDELGGGTLGLASEFACRTSDNDSSDPVECDVFTGVEGSSFASPAAAGAGLLVRDYFAQGFYPDGTSANPGNTGDQHTTISGALLKAVLISSAEFMTGGWAYRAYRFNNEIGYGRIELDNALPLESWPASPTGLIVVDGETGFGDLSGLDGSVNASTGATDSEEFVVCDDEQPLRIALAWIEESGNALVNDLHLEVEAPSGRIYYGNYFTDDDDRDEVIDDTLEDCPGIDGWPSTYNGEVDSSRWSLPICVRGDASTSPHDTENTTEAVMLSHDYDGDGWILGEHPDPNPDDDNQIEIGTWKIRVVAPGGDTETDQRYAVALAGGVCIGSSVRFNTGSYVCNSRADITVNEFDEPADAGSLLSIGEVEGRLMVQVIDPAGTDTCSAGTCSVGGGSCVDNDDCNAVDVEDGADLGFTQPDLAAYKYVAEDIILSDGTARDPGNGILDVRSGDKIRVIYQDEDSGTPNANKRRVSSADVDCDVSVGFGDITFGQFGMDTTYYVDGGCERNARGFFEFGYPDRYMDEDELISFNFAFASTEDIDLEQVDVNLSCVLVDGDSPEGCKPNSNDCADPNRTNNTPCDSGPSQYMTILDTPKTIGLIPAGSALSANFSILMASSIPGTPEIEMLLEVISETSGKTSSGLGVSRHVLDADESSVYYNTDWPTGGVAYRDRNNDEVINGFLGQPPVPGDVDTIEPTTQLGDFRFDYKFEAIRYGDLTAGGTRNTTLQTPWNFDVTAGGFTSGVGAATDQGAIGDVIAQWGEDKNFNGINDGYCQVDDTVWCESTDDCDDAGLNPPTCVSLEDRDDDNNKLDRNWSTLGGCGWQTKAPNRCSNDPRRGCYDNDDCISPGTCTLAPWGKGGIWHTGRIGSTTEANCLVLGATAGQCQAYETITGTTGQRLWFELLVTPEVQKVNDDYGMALMDWGWNQAVDLPDWNAYWTWEVDTNTREIEPVNLVSDLGLLNFGNGPFGAIVNQNNPDLTNGFTVYSPVAGTCRVSTGIACTSNADCPMTCWIGGASCASSADCLGTFCLGGTNNGAACAFNYQCNSNNCVPNFCDACSNLYDVTGGAGNNREGKNSCAFLGASGIHAQALTTLGLALPVDDDIDNDSNASIDEYLTKNGPLRNMDIFAFNGPDMRYTTLEDIYGEAGDYFQAAVGILNFEKPTPTDPDPIPGFGIAVDDMFFEWREFFLTDDNSTCSTGGECATIDMQTTNFFEGSTRLEITVLEKSPPWTHGASNDCNFDQIEDGTYDCDSDGTNDLPVKAYSEVEPAGEIIFANHVGGYLYHAELPVSALYDVPGVLFAQPMGQENPSVCAYYLDNDDGQGNICQNDPDPNIQGRVENCSTLFFTRASVTVLKAIMSDNRDNDGWADTNETVDMQIQIANKSGVPLNNLYARLMTNDPAIECILGSTIAIGGMEADEIRFTAESFTFKVADIDRTDLGLGPTDLLQAEFSIIISGDEFGATYAPQTVTIPLDLDATGGGGPYTFIETFQNGDFGTFTTMNLDSGRHSFAMSDGWRCQYSDPDWTYSNSYGQDTGDVCYLANSVTYAANYYWKIDSVAAGTNARSYDSDGHSLYMGVYRSADELWTTPAANMDAVGSANPINIGFAPVCSETRNVPCDTDSDCSTDACPTCNPGEVCQPVSPELSFKHQISLVDWRHTGADYRTSADAGIVALQQADTDSAGTPVGDWIKIYPYYNDYDQQRHLWWTNCMFDPTDDGSTEDDFFNPEDPFRRLGPSSTCGTEFNFSYSGDTDADFAPGNVNFATEPDSGLQGYTGTGTWIESRFNLDSYKAMRIRLRFLTTATKVEGGETWEDIAAWNPGPWDDGWWIDQIVISDTLQSFAVLSNDDKDNSSLPTCGSICADDDSDGVGDVFPDLVADPAGTLGAPGQSVELDAVDSYATRCLNGSLQFRFWIDNDGDSSGGGVLDELLRGWTDNPVIVNAPDATTTYVVEVRCSSDPETCVDSTALQVPVNCPWSGTARTDDYWGDIFAYAGYCSDDAEEFCTTNTDCAGTCTMPHDGTIFLSWATKGSRRKGSTVRLDDGGKALGGYNINQQWMSLNMKGFQDASIPTSGEVWGYLIRPDGPYCNQPGSWQNWAGSEPTRDTSLP